MLNNLDVQRLLQLPWFYPPIRQGPRMMRFSLASSFLNSASLIFLRILWSQSF
jgi:hypothetical protein